MAFSSSSHKRSFSEYQSETFASRKFYDVFINHRGPDTKDTVALALYDSLEEMGFWTFLDDQELQLGDSVESAIQNAIYSSKVQIAVFSPRYAESSWCLDELLLMLETGALFIPIFCDVKPSDLRSPDKRVYAPAFAQYQEKGTFSNKRLQQWKEALHISSLISGYEFSTSNDNVEMLCTKIALAVQQVVGKTCKGFPRYVEVPKDQICLRADSAASTSTSAHINKKSSLLPRDSHPVGIHSKVEEMLRLLKDPQIRAIAVVGMGGLGKTFLLQNVYNKTKSSFDISIWLSISKSYSVKSLQHDIAFHLGLRGEIVDGAISEETAAELIHERLQGIRCLIVLDDLWTLSTEGNLLYKLGLPTHKDCKVVMTTRNKEVARNSKAHIYEMKLLSDEDSWELFGFYAFPDCAKSRAPSNLAEVGREIVKQCGNLPLAIKTTAASLANTTRLSKWESKRDQLRRPATPFGGHDPVMDILKLSYDSLPPHLKPCFSYLSFFPEDEEIDPEYLVYLWIAEGLIPAGEEQWDTAWDWIDQLVQLCLLQLWEDLKSNGFSYFKRLTKHCKIHDLLHDLAIHISRENKCAFSVQEASTHTSAGTGWCRILLAKKDINDHALTHSRPVYLRTLSLSQNRITSIPENLFNAMRGLRVLDLSFTGISALPASIGKMILLKVLNLRGTMIEQVPECVRYLKSLLFLGIPRCKCLPDWISELECLQHLECAGVSFRPKGISNMLSLRTLRSIFIELPIEEDLAKMSQLQEVKLPVKNDMEVNILAQLVNLRYLEMKHNGETNPLQFPQTMRAMKHLDRLTLRMFAVPSWICDLVNLRELNLLRCGYGDFPEFQRMPNLVSLNLNENSGRMCLNENYRCKRLSKEFGKSGGFPNLRFLEIFYFTQLEEFPQLEEGAMAYLEEFHLTSCRNLEKVGEGLEKLKRLQNFRFVGYGDRQRGLVNLFQEGGEYWKKIKAMNPHVNICSYV